MQLVSKISNLCDHNPPTLQTDGRTDGRHAIPRPRICTKVHCAVKTTFIHLFNDGIVDLVGAGSGCADKGASKEGPGPLSALGCEDNAREYTIRLQ